MSKKRTDHGRILRTLASALLIFLPVLPACRDQDKSNTSQQEASSSEDPPRQKDRSKPQPEATPISRKKSPPEPVAPPAPLQPDPTIDQPDAPVAESTPRKPAGPAPILPIPVLPEITPLEMTEASREVKLPGSFKNLVLGGGGRFVILHFQDRRTLGIFDASAGKIVKFIPVAGDDILFAANADSLVVLLRDKKIFQRWSLTDFEQSLTQAFGESKEPTWMVMGSASSGPLVVGVTKDYQDETLLFDPANFKKLTYSHEREQYAEPLPCSDGPQVRASANGQVFTAWRMDLSPSGLYCAEIKGGSFINRYEHTTVGYIHPSPDGRQLLTAEGFYSPDLKPARPGDRQVTSHPVPAAHGPFYLSIPSTDSFRDEAKVAPATLHLTGDTRPLVTLPTVRVNADHSVSRSREDLSLDKQVIYIPDANIAVTYPKGRDKLILHRIDLDEELRKSAVDYLFITSSPDIRLKPGDTWTYTPDIRSKNEVTLSLDSAPEGMTLSGKKISWDVPADAPSSTHSVVVSIKDTTGQELFHNFNLAVGDAAPGTAPAVAPPKTVSKPMKPSPAPEIKGPELAGKDHVPFKLPAALSNIALGGNGRFLVMHFPSLRKLGIFDVNTAKIVKYIPANDDNLHFAAGLGKLVIVEGEKRLVSRWDLHSFEREIVAPLEVDGPPEFVIMGSNSEGPVVIGTADRSYDAEAHFLDLASLRKIELNRSGDHNNISKNFRASADGRVFTSWSSDTSPSGVQILVMNGTSLVGYYEHCSVGHLAPGPKGDRIYSGEGIWTKEAKLVGSSDEPHKPYFPAVHGDFYLSLESDPESREVVKTKLGLHLRGHDQGLSTIDNLEPLLEGIFDRDENFLPLDKRIHFIPSANLLVIVGLTKDVLHLYPVDIEATLAKSEFDYLLVTSAPPAVVQSDQSLDYQMKVLSKQGGLTYKLESGPAGMTLGEDGLLTWNVPADSQDERHSIIILVSDKSGQEVFHTFDLQVERTK